MIDVGQSVGNYNITATLGSGGMGTVFLAEHPVIGSKVALKAIHPQFARSAEIFARFVNEAKAVNQIRHDHIIDITDFGTAPTGDFYFMMEYLQGDTLSGALKGGGRFPPARALNVAAQIADALGASHEHGVIHRDLKPENIFLIVRDGVDDFVKVLDFGLAKLTNPDEVATYESRAGSVMGTAFYMSPEQCEGRKEIDARADVYSLGVILFEMLTGMIPFGGEGYGEILVKHITVAPPAARSIVPDLPAALDSILFRALAKEPTARFQSMAEFREALLDPERYASLNPPPEAVQADFSGRVRAAKPMARTELALVPALAAGPGVVEGPGRGHSTFRDSVGEVWVREDSLALAPKTHRVRTMFVAGVIGAAVFAGVRYRHQTTRFLDAAAAVTTAPSKPARVRVSFNSDPEGAAVARADGTLLGVTPLSTDVPYGEVATAYVFHKDGYLPKTASLVPNTPSPLFEVLQRNDPARVLAPPAPVADVVSLDPPLPTPPNLDAPTTLPKLSAKRWGHVRSAARTGSHFVPTEPTRDDAMEPTAPPAPPEASGETP